MFVEKFARNFKPKTVITRASRFVKKTKLRLNGEIQPEIDVRLLNQEKEWSLIKKAKQITKKTNHRKSHIRLGEGFFESNS